MAASFAAGGLAGGTAIMGLLEAVGLLDLLQAGAVPLVLAGAYAAGRTLWGWFSGSRDRKLRAVADRLTGFVEENAAAPANALPPRSDDR
jgi:hypothetical protein